MSNTVRTVRPGPGDLEASIVVPSSKSIANRALVCASLADGVSRVASLPGGDDTDVLLASLGHLGLLTERADTVAVVRGDPAVWHRGGGDFDAGLAGTTSRFLVACSALGAQWSSVDGEEALRARPISQLLEALRTLGAETDTPSGGLPVRLRRGRGGLGGRVIVNGSVSSQFISALMLVAPAMDRDLDIEIEGDLVSRPYVEMTAAVMALYGAPAVVGTAHVSVPATGYRPAEMEVEGDWSSAAFPLCASLLRAGTVSVRTLRETTSQGDRQIAAILAQAGVTITQNGSTVTARSDGPESLQPLDADLRDCSDLLPALCVGATAIKGRSIFRGVGFVRAKESDRLGDLAAEIEKLGHACEVGPDWIGVHGGAPPARTEIPRLATHHDHRLAMALALGALSGGPVEIESPDVVSKSWPSYWADMEPILGA